MSSPLRLALNHLLDQSAWARDRLRAFSGRCGRIAMGSMAVEFSVAADGRLAEAPADDALVYDVEIVLPADTPVRLLQGGSEAAMKAARISGAADFADALGFVLRNLRWDVEEDLSQVVGDIAAHRLVRGGQAFLRWQQEVLRRTGERFAAHVLHEKPTLVGDTALKVFSAEVAALLKRLDAAEQRATRLRR